VGFDIKDILMKFLPKDAREALPKLLELIERKEISSDLVIILNQVESGLRKASVQPTTNRDLKSIFNQAAGLTSIGKTYLKNKKISMFNLPKVMSGLSNAESNGKILEQAIKNNDPAVLAFAESLQKDAVLMDAVKRIVVNTNGKVFRLEENKDGSAKAIELVTGKQMSIPIDAQYYAEIKKALGDIAAPKKPKGPSPS